MGSKANYTKLLAEREAVQKNTEYLVNSKLNYLRSVGISVITKKLSHGWRNEELSFLGDVALWLKHGGDIHALTEDNVELASAAATSQRPKGVYKIPTKFLRVSDRDFAHYLRQKIYDRKNYLKKLELHNAANSIKEIEADMENKRKELVRLQNMVKDEQEKLEKKTEEHARKQAK